MQNRAQWYYRGSLKSCNYTCSYCPFSKKRASEKEREKDRRALQRFVEYQMGMPQEPSAVLMVPYGEALIWDYYWEALARLSRLPWIELVGAQTNLSFSVEEMIALYCGEGGDLPKLRLWGTFHPEMASPEAFAGQVRSLGRHGVAVSAGCVGVPGQLPLIRRLREVLPESTYLWVNKMDGLGRDYTAEECRLFSQIDVYFAQELRRHPANPEKCVKSRFVEASGAVCRCNLSGRKLGNLYEGFSAQESEQLPGHMVCRRKECSCYLAYCNSYGQEFAAFAPYPAFRMPEGKAEEELVCGGWYDSDWNERE